MTCPSCRTAWTVAGLASLLAALSLLSVVVVFRTEQGWYIRGIAG